jgi:hypothetical protein
VGPAEVATRRMTRAETVRGSANERSCNSRGRKAISFDSCATHGGRVVVGGRGASYPTGRRRSVSLQTGS